MGLMVMLSVLCFITNQKLINVLIIKTEYGITYEQMFIVFVDHLMLCAVFKGHRPSKQDEDSFKLKEFWDSKL